MCNINTKCNNKTNVNSAGGRGHSQCHLVTWVSGPYCFPPKPVRSHALMPGNHYLNFCVPFLLLACFLLFDVVLPPAFVMNMCESKLLNFLALGLYINCIQYVFCGLLPSIRFWDSPSDVFDLSLFISTAEKFHCLNVPHFICPVSCRRTSRSFHVVIHRAVHTLDSLSPELSLWGWTYLLSYWLTSQVTGSSSRT